MAVVDLGRVSGDTGPAGSTGASGQSIWTTSEKLGVSGAYSQVSDGFLNQMNIEPTVGDVVIGSDGAVGSIENIRDYSDGSRIYDVRSDKISILGPQGPKGDSSSLEVKQDILSGTIFSDIKYSINLLSYGKLYYISMDMTIPQKVSGIIDQVTISLDSDILDDISEANSIWGDIALHLIDNTLSGDISYSMLGVSINLNRHILIVSTAGLTNSGSYDIILSGHSLFFLIR